MYTYTVTIYYLHTYILSLPTQLFSTWRRPFLLDCSISSTLIHTAIRKLRRLLGPKSILFLIYLLSLASLYFLASFNSIFGIKINSFKKI